MESEVNTSTEILYVSKQNKKLISERKTITESTKYLLFTPIIINCLMKGDVIVTMFEVKRFMEELAEIQVLRERVCESLRNAPRGRLRSFMSKGKYPQYYLIDDKEKYSKGRYLNKNDIEMAKRLSQKEYDMKVLNAINKREKEINYLISIAKSKKEIENVYNRLPVAKQMLVTPYFISDAEFIKKWKSEQDKKTITYNISNGFQTENGELVRSKSEKMIADKLFYRNIPYKYEKELMLSKKTIYPDFTLLKIDTREEIYLEHFGMMDNPEYCKNALEKIELYESNGIYIGDRLIVSFESSLKPISMKEIDANINKVFLGLDESIG